MIESSRELLQLHLLRDKITALPTVQAARKDDDSEKEVRDSFTFLLEPDVMIGKLILYKDQTAKITLICHSCEIEAFSKISDIMLSGSPFAVLPENLCSHGRHSEVFSSERKAYLQVLNFYKWVLRERCGQERVAGYDSQPLSETETETVLSYFQSID